jgi:hypothetical protein
MTVGIVSSGSSPLRFCCLHSKQEQDEKQMKEKKKTKGCIIVFLVSYCINSQV